MFSKKPALRFIIFFDIIKTVFSQRICTCDITKYELNTIELSIFKSGYMLPWEVNQNTICSINKGEPYVAMETKIKSLSNVNHLSIYGCETVEDNFLYLKFELLSVSSS